MKILPMRDKKIHENQHFFKVYTQCWDTAPAASAHLLGAERLLTKHTPMCIHRELPTDQTCRLCGVAQKACARLISDPLTLHRRSVWSLESAAGCRESRRAHPSTLSSAVSTEGGALGIAADDEAKLLCNSIRMCYTARRAGAFPQMKATLLYSSKEVFSMSSKRMNDQASQLLQEPVMASSYVMPKGGLAGQAIGSGVGGLVGGAIGGAMQSKNRSNNPSIRLFPQMCMAVGSTQFGLYRMAVGFLANSLKTPVLVVPKQSVVKFELERKMLTAALHLQLADGTALELEVHRRYLQDAERVKEALKA